MTTAPSDWSAVSSNIVPNFGDYTDNYVERVGTAPYNGTALYTAWSDRRLGVPQPFEAHTSTVGVHSVCQNMKNASRRLAPIKVKRCIRCEFYIMRAPHRRCYAVPGWERADRFGDAGPPPSPSHNPERGGRPPLSLFPAAFPRQWPAPRVATAFWVRLSITLGATDGGPGKARQRYFILGGV
jgi:hypothetical protein